MPQRRTLNDQATRMIQGALEGAPHNRTFPPEVQQLMPSEEDQATPPGHPASWKPEPFVNDPEVQRMLHEFLRVAPGLGERLNHIQVGDDTASGEMIEGSSMKGRPMADTNLLGTTDVIPGKENNVALSPRLLYQLKDEMPSTLVHELLHTLGAGEGQAYDVSDKLNKFNIFDKGKQ